MKNLNRAWKLSQSSSLSLTQPSIPSFHSSNCKPTHQQSLQPLHSSSNMKTLAFSAALLSQLALQAAAGSDKLSKRQLSLPPLIPSIPGVTEPLNDLAPPLPILQIPTPALDSPFFPVKNIKPKKIGYFWTGAGDNKHKDFLVTASLDDVSQTYIHFLEFRGGGC